MKSTSKKKNADKKGQMGKAAAQPKKSRRGAAGPFDLSGIDPLAESGAFPAWVRKRFPSYTVESHIHGPVKTVRQLDHGGHHVEIETTYAVKLDGRPFPIHMMVDREGNLWSHLCPYHTFRSAVELVQFLMDRLPEAFNAAPQNGGHDHGGHDHGSGHHH